MLKHKSIIEQLSLRQKIALLTDLNAFSDPKINAMGVPIIKLADFATLGKEIGISYESAINTWNSDLIESVAEAIATVARGRWYQLLLSPDLKCIANPCLDGLSEDAYLNGVFGMETARAARIAGAACVFSQFSIDESYVEYLDLHSDKQAIHELVVKPFEYATESADSFAVLSSLNYVKNGYTNVNNALFQDVVNGILGQDVYVFSKDTPSTVDFHEYLSGTVCIGGAELMMDRAVGRFNQLMKYRSEGSATDREVSGALSDGSAIDEETLNEAVDRVIEFSYTVNRLIPEVKPFSRSEEIWSRFAQESIVLLKNDGLLPIKQPKRIAVFGDIDDGYNEFKDPLAFVGSVRGYDDDEEQSESMLNEAVRLAAEADLLLIFLRRKNDGEGEWKLPANRIALIETLRCTGKRMIAVLDESTDVSFDKDFSAVLVVPSGKYAHAALIDVLVGKVNPSGRLARTYYDYPDEYFRVLKEDKEKKKTRVGVFVGYRYYDFIDMNVRYPFGFGLSYTDFAYSGLKIDGDNVSFRVKNIGNYAGAETAQIYIGRSCRDVVPKKQLKAFVKIPLEAGESKVVTVTIPSSRYAEFDKNTLSEYIAEGSYTIYVGASVSDIRLKGKRYLKGEKRAKSDDCASDYFRDLSNIGGKYCVNHTTGKSYPLKNKLHSIFLAALCLFVFIAIIVGYVYLTEEEHALTTIVTFFIFLGFSFCALICLCVDKKRRTKLILSENETSQKQHPNTEYTPKELFDTAFKKEEKSSDEQIFTNTSQYYDEKQTYEEVFRDFRKFSTERGIVIEENNLRNFIASLSTSGLLIVNGDEMKLLNMFCSILGDYFGTKVYADNAEDYKTSNDIVNKYNLRYMRGITIFQQACRAARSESARIHLVILRHMKTAVLSDVFSEIADDWQAGWTVAQDSSSARERSYVFPPNLWVIVALENGADFGKIPQSVADFSATLVLRLRECDPSTTKTLVKPFGYYQFSNMIHNVRNKFELDERLWKRIDLLDEKISEISNYRISNRLWIKIEKHISAFLACGGSDTESLDAAVATELLTAILPYLKKINEESFLTVLEEIFGSEEIAFCRALAQYIKLSKEDKD